ncbi:MAG: putative membrane protein insertion efficiency factor [Microgenomates group bacterium ADurb.Bin238]|jgi:putative membrane protein insertion efficiency factor|uniref:Putative membrane protein insertion efficiency factor n=1 Tax=Candidatus Chazhemtobacterium aquaticus TaxID=2715735 RepID=A0A857N4P1_9BACT|nr:membrane protein insertion efficiency factor YidD [Candidatus Chazhemtobacterium aquaticus]OQA83788.1 MAG: putative membrane protein insertion efficiency factor [Microgenomates group bacterium ADurb.Bin238]QHO63205.1 Protein YidD [Candidatus Chazhemtobacterium aquaticus]
MIISIYQRYVSPVLHGLISLVFGSPAGCRFYPTCSEYSHQAIRKYGIIRGSVLSLKRLLRCHPLSSGGYDPVV